MNERFVGLIASSGILVSSIASAILTPPINPPNLYKFVNVEIDNTLKKIEVRLTKIEKELVNLQISNSPARYYPQQRS